MSDPSDQRWARPGDAAGEPEDPSIEREDTVAFATEHTQQVRRSDPPPPPPPPTATGGWAPPPPPGSGPAYGAGGWQPPPTPRRRTGLVVGVALGVLALVFVVGVGAVLLVRTVDGGPGQADVEMAQPDPFGEPAPDGAPDPGSVSPELEAQAEAVLRTINESEERMLAFQQVVFESLDDDGSVGDGAARIAQEAQRTGDDLTSLRSDLRSLAGGEADGFDGLRDVRDTYAGHMEAWIAYVDAVAGSPALAAPGSSDAEGLWRDIETTGDDFVTAMDTGLPDDLPAALEDLARFIVERGFGGGGDGGGDVV